MLQMSLLDWVFDPVVQRSLIACLILALAAIPLGLIVVYLRLSLINEAIAHSTLPGVVLAVQYGGGHFLALLVGGLASSLVMVFGAVYVGARATIERRLGGLHTVFVALGGLLALRYENSSTTPDVDHAGVGDDHADHADHADHDNALDNHAEHADHDHALDNHEEHADHDNAFDDHADHADHDHALDNHAEHDNALDNHADHADLATPLDGHAGHAGHADGGLSLDHLLFGTVFSISWAQVLVLTLAVVLVLSVLWSLRGQVVTLLVDPSQLQVRVRARLQMIVLLCLCLILVVASNALGVLLASGFVLLPVLAIRHFVRDNVVALIGWSIGLVWMCSIAGIVLAWLTGGWGGPAIVVLLSVLWGLSSFYGKFSQRRLA